MPEQPEVRVMSNYFNHKLDTEKIVKVEKSPISKNKCDLSRLHGKTWKASSDYRGKEMMVTFTSENETHKLKIGFARIGFLQICDVNTIPEDFDRNAMLRFYTEKEILYLYDYTRFSIWRWSDDWDTNRSPDIVKEHNAWRDYLYRHRKCKKFKKEIFQILVDQKYFNGIGNFSRTEILCRTKASPFMTFNEILENDELRNDFFEVCRETLNDIAVKGGLQFKHWKNPFNVDKTQFNKWVRCYNKLPDSYYQRDSDGRLFWFDKKYLFDYVIWAKKALKEGQIQDTRLLEKIYKKIRKK